MSDIDNQKTKKQCCRYAHPNLKPGGVQWVCIHDINHERPAEITDQCCENCSHFDSKYIEYPIQVSKVETHTGFDLESKHIGCFCEVRPADDEKTYLGIFLGELPISIATSYDPKTQVLSSTMVRNPALYVPELKKIVYGCESWWHLLEKGEKPYGISDKDIQNQPYAKLLQSMLQSNPVQENS